MSAETMLGEIRPIEARCAAEPIHTPGSIQAHGVLFAADPARDLILVAASANAVALPGAGPDPLAISLFDLLGESFVSGLAQRARAGALTPSMPWETTVDLGGAAYDIASHIHDGLVLIELEPADPGDPDSALLATRRLQRAIAHMRENDGTLEDLAATVVRSLRLMTGYERVLVYRFDAEWNGEAIAEDQVPGWQQSLRGLHFPASDIPSQARALYRLSLMRWVPSRDSRPVPLLVSPDRGPKPIDLGHARLRSLSPTHLQYHRHLGVDGTMSLSIMDGKRLWGLMVFHHRKPHRTSAGQRAAAAALTDAFALRIGPAERAGAEAQRLAEQHRFATLIAHLAQVEDLHVALSSGPVTIRDLFDATGAAAVIGGNALLLGSTPPREEVLRFANWLSKNAPPGPVFASTILPELAPDWAAHAALASGAMAAFLSDDRADLLIWFRPEEPRMVSWGGSPHKTPETAMLPRQSFERWVEERRGHARPWAAYELEIAAMLRHAIAEVIVRNLRRIQELNEQLRQSQKMEAVGQLTGGLAHDFNNLLGGINGSIELAQTRLAQGRGSEIGRYLAAALGATKRAASLTHRLLAFSRRQTLDPRPIDVNRLIASLEDLIRRTVGPAIRVDSVTSAGLWPILCDGNQLENAVLNLALNGRDAMPQGGRLTIEATNARLDDAYAARHDIPPGHYVALSVSDTGQGMTPEIIQKAFEPFYTTKKMGEGTGLGLSMVYGFARQSGGHARIYSEPGQGTTVRLYLPRSHLPEHDDTDPDENDLAPPPSGICHILVVDDEPVLRMLVVEVLRDAGFLVTEAADGKQAMEVVTSEVSIDLLLTDVGLPNGLNGRQLVEAARGHRRNLRVLFITGYAENAALSGGLLDANTQVLTKPFGMRNLVEKIGEMLS